jgi:hypothetical protein
MTLGNAVSEINTSLNFDNSNWYTFWLDFGIVACSAFGLEKLAIAANLRFVSHLTSGTCSTFMKFGGHGMLVGFFGSLGFLGSYKLVDKACRNIPDAVVALFCGLVGATSLYLVVSTLPPLVSFSNAQLVANAIACAAPWFSAVMAVCSAEESVG